MHKSIGRLHIRRTFGAIKGRFGPRGVFCEYYMRVREEKGSLGGILVLCFVSPGASCRCISCEWCSNTPVNREGLWMETEANGRGVVGNISFSGYIRLSSNLPHLSGVPRQD